MCLHTKHTDFVLLFARKPGRFVCCRVIGSARRELFERLVRAVFVASAVGRMNGRTDRELTRRNNCGRRQSSLQRSHSIDGPARKTDEPCGVKEKHQREAVVKAQAKDY